jgi:hypothetical protein
MPKISELSPILGRDTEARDLFVTVNIKSGATGTKNITRAELIQSIQRENFNNLVVTGGNFSNFNIGTYSGFTGDLADNDIFLIKDVSTGNTFAMSFSKLQQELSESFLKETRVYVSAETRGEGIGSFVDPFASIEDAIDYVNNNEYEGAVSITLFPGEYITDGILEIPDDCSFVSASGPHTVSLEMSPGNEENNCLLVGSGCLVEGITFKNQRVNNFDNPSSGFAVAFRPGALITKSPIIKNCIQMSNDDSLVIDEPLSPVDSNQFVGRGGGLVLADRSVLNQNSLFTSMFVDSCQARSFNGVGIVAKNGSEVIGTNVVTMFNREGYFGLNGGKVILENSSTYYGDITFRTSGSTNVVIPSETNFPAIANSSFADELLFYRTDIIDDMWNFLLNEGYSVDGDLVKRDIGNMITAIAYDFRVGSQINTRNFVATLFDYNATLFDINTTTLVDAYNDAFDRVENYILTDPRIVPSSDQANTVTGLIEDVVKATVANPVTRAFSSIVESTGHYFGYAGAGVNKNAMSINNRRLGTATTVRSTILREGNTRIRYSGMDELNNQYFSDGLRLNSVSNKLEGRAFSSALKKYTRRAANNRISL